MSELNSILQDINEARIDISSSNKYDEVIELYKLITVKLIISCESTFYKICITNSLKINLKSNVIYDHLNIFLQRLLLDLTQNNFTQDINQAISQINKSCEENSVNVIYDKLFFLIDNFYNTFDRSKLISKNYEKYKKYIVKSIINFFKSNTVEIIQLIKDKKYKWKGDYSLSKVDSELNSLSSSNTKISSQSIEEESSDSESSNKRTESKSESESDSDSESELES